MSAEKISLKEAAWQTGGGSQEFRYRLGIELGHIKPTKQICTCLYWWDIELNEGHKSGCVATAERQED